MLVVADEQDVLYSSFVVLCIECNWDSPDFIRRTRHIESAKAVGLTCFWRSGDTSLWLRSVTPVVIENELHPPRFDIRAPLYTK